MSRDLDIAALVIAYCYLVHCYAGTKGWIGEIRDALAKRITELIKEDN